MRFDVQEVNTDGTPGAMLAQYYTGPVAKQSVATWVQYGFSFINQHSSSLYFSIYNLETGTNGNDLVLDDIEMHVCTQATRLQGDTIYCPFENINLKDEYGSDQSPTPNNATYWLYSTDKAKPLAQWDFIYTGSSLNGYGAVKNGYFCAVLGSLSNIEENNLGCVSISDTFRVQVTPDLMYWHPMVPGNNWNEPANWADSNGDRLTTETGEILNVVPRECTTVHVPGDLDAYPWLDPVNTPRNNVYGDTRCDSIIFHYGGEDAKTNYLTYNYAVVDLTLKSDRWYMLSAPLRQMVSGDYFTETSLYRQNPEVFMMYYQTNNPQTGSAKQESKFSGFFNNLDEELVIGKGYAAWVDDGDDASIIHSYTIRFPKKDNVEYRYYDDITNAVTRVSGIMPRDKCYRFIYEGSSTYQFLNGNFGQDFDNTAGYGQLIIGNPFMSHLDIVGFQGQNNTYLGHV